MCIGSFKNYQNLILMRVCFRCGGIVSFFERTRPAAGMRLPCLVYTSTSIGVPCCYSMLHVVRDVWITCVIWHTSTLLLLCVANECDIWSVCVMWYSNTLLLLRVTHEPDMNSSCRVLVAWYALNSCRWKLAGFFTFFQKHVLVTGNKIPSIYCY